MTEAATIAWIFYALSLASGAGPANFAAISQIADGINHAVPTHKEMQSSLRWLKDAGLVSKSSRGYVLTPAGAEMIAETNAKTLMDIWNQLTDKIGTRIDLSPNISLERTRGR
jgi:predicted transcriptional regulator